MLHRCWAALYPRANFLDVLEGNPDLYGPFWIATTVVLILFLGGTISDYLASTGKGQFAYDFRLLSGKHTVPRANPSLLPFVFCSSVLVLGCPVLFFLFL